MYCYDNSTDGYYTGASGKALQDEGFGFHVAIQTVPPPVEAVNLTAAMMSAMIAPDPAIGTKVVCAYPVAVIWQNILGYLVPAYDITQFFRPVTWCKGNFSIRNVPCTYLFMMRIMRDTAH